MYNNNNIYFCVGIAWTIIFLQLYFIYKFINLLAAVHKKKLLASANKNAFVYHPWNSHSNFYNLLQFTINHLKQPVHCSEERWIEVLWATLTCTGYTGLCDLKKYKLMYCCRWKFICVSRFTCLTFLISLIHLFLYLNFIQ